MPKATPAAVAVSCGNNKIGNMALIKHDPGLVEQERKRRASGRDDPPDSYTWHRQPGNMGVSGITHLGSEQTVENVHLDAYSGTTSALFGKSSHQCRRPKRRLNAARLMSHTCGAVGLCKMASHGQLRQLTIRERFRMGLKI